MQLRPTRSKEEEDDHHTRTHGLRPRSNTRGSGGKGGVSIRESEAKEYTAVLTEHGSPGDTHWDYLGSFGVSADHDTEDACTCKVLVSGVSQGPVHIQATSFLYPCIDRFGRRLQPQARRQNYSRVFRYHLPHNTSRSLAPLLVLLYRG